MVINYYDKKGKLSSSTFEVSDSIFAVRINEALLAQYVYSYLSNQREANAHTKDRGEVSGGGKKPWNQKGTGRARAGSIRSPLWKGGGVTFGPKNTRNFKKKLTKKMTKAAMRSAFSVLAKNKAVSVMDNFEMGKPNTKNVITILKDFAEIKKLTLIQNGSSVELMMAVRNLPNIKLLNVNELNAYDLVNASHIILFSDTLDIINKNWGTEKKSVAPVKKEVKVKTVTKKAKSTK
jgi:large subunit ribosomal protein L4